MAATTTLKLPEDLKEKIGPLAEAEGKTPHAWMVEAIALQAGLAAKSKAFRDVGRSRLQAFEQNRAVYKADDVRRYFTALASGRKAARPKPIKV